MTTIVSSEENQVARPLSILVPLIREDLEQAKEASERAGLPYYRSAGEKLLEAKEQIEYGEFKAWVARSFKISHTQANLYMRLVDTERKTPGRFSSLHEFRKKHLGEKQTVYPQDWHEPIKKIIGTIDTGALNRRRAETARIDEREVQRKLALQLIDIGYKALATKLHPDKGGSKEAMVRLNQVRDRLKQHI